MSDFGCPTLALQTCNKLDENQIWKVIDNQIMTKSNECIGLNQEKLGIHVCTCNGEKNQQWEIIAGRIMSLDVPTKCIGIKRAKIHFGNCELLNQLWALGKVETNEPQKPIPKKDQESFEDKKSMDKVREVRKIRKKKRKKTLEQ